MRLPKLDEPNTLSAARGRMASFRWRVITGLVYAAAAALVLNSLWLGLGWFALLCATMGGDYLLAKRYLAATNAQARKAAGAVFIGACIVSILMFTSMAVCVALLGGTDGRLLSSFMAAGLLVSVMLFFFQAPAFMMITAVPAAACLMFIPFAPQTEAPGDPMWSAIGAALGLAAFLAHVVRTANNCGRMFAGLQEAHRTAQQRQADAEGKRAEAEAANRTKTEFLTTMTHELRTPLNAVIGYSEIIGEDMEMEGRKDLAADAKRINSAARHLLGLIDQILQLSHLDGDRADISLGDVDVRDVIEKAVAGVSDEAKANNNRIATRIAQDVTFAHTDRDKLSLCLAQLLSNAAKFTSNGLLAVSADRERGQDREWLRIAVSDTGVGMTQDEVAKAFQPFTQIDASKTRAQGGMGLGLSITLRTAQALGGDVAAVSEPGAGSTFTLRIPLQFALTEAGGGLHPDVLAATDIGAAA